MNYIVYKITNNVNGMYYIGAHATENLNDDYMGSGKYIKRWKLDPITNKRIYY